MRQLDVGVATLLWAPRCGRGYIWRTDSRVMGSAESRFNGLLVQGNEKEALDLWQSHPELQAQFRPNLPIKSTRYRDAPLHVAARNDMKLLMQEFLTRGADPRAKNSNGETPLHIVCRSARFSSRANRVRADLLRLLLDRLSPFEQNIHQDIGSGVLCESEESEWGSGDSMALGRDRFSRTGEADPYNLALSDKVILGVRRCIASCFVFLYRIATLHYI